MSNEINEIEIDESEINEKCEGCQCEIEDEPYQIGGLNICEDCYGHSEESFMRTYAEDIGELMIEFMRENYGLFADAVEDDKDLKEYEYDDEEDLRDHMTAIFGNVLHSTLFENYVYDYYHERLGKDIIDIIVANICQDYEGYIHKVIEEYNELTNAPVLK